MRQLVLHVSTYAGTRNKGRECTERGAKVGQGNFMRCNKKRERDVARFAQMKRHESDTRQGGRRSKEAAVERGQWHLKSRASSRGRGSSEEEGAGTLKTAFND